MIVSTKEIHWIGAGLSTGTGLKRIVKTSKTHLSLEQNPRKCRKTYTKSRYLI